MKSGHRSILYIFIIIIIASGLALFLLRRQAVDFLSAKTGVAQPSLPLRTASSSGSALDTSLLSAPKFTALKNNVNDFKFDYICNTAVGRVEKTATSSDGTVSTSSQPVSCRLGNNTPFPLPVKTK